MERKHQHILNIARAHLFQANTPNFFWSYAVTHVVYIINRIPSPILNNKSPYLMIFNKEHDLYSLKVFGYLTYDATIQSQRTNLDPRGRKCIFLGFKQGTKGVILLDLNNHDIFTSRNITHHEHIFPFNPNWKYYPSHQPANN